MEIARLAANEDLVEQRRKQLADLSTFMRELHEWVARHSNREDGVGGRFWQGRFRCQNTQRVVSALKIPIRAEPATV